MDFIIRNLEALGDEVAAALDDLADEVTGRAQHRRYDERDDDDHDNDDVDRAGSASDDSRCDRRSVGSCSASAEDYDPHHLEHAVGSEDTASVQSDDCGGAGELASAAGPRPERGPPVVMTMGRDPAPLPVPVRSPSTGLRRRKPLLAGMRIDPPPPPAEADALRGPPPAALADHPRSTEPRHAVRPVSDGGTNPQQQQRPPQLAPAAAAQAPVVAVQVAVPQMVSTAVGSTTPPPSPALDRRDFAASRAVERDTLLSHAAGHRREASGFDLCDNNDPDARSPTEEGEYLVL